MNNNNNTNYVKIGIFLMLIVIIVFLLVAFNQKKQHPPKSNENNSENIIENFTSFNGSYIPDVPKNTKNYQFQGKCTYTPYPKDYEKNHLGWRKYLTKNEYGNATQQSSN
jgi:hypothetical protein